MFPKQTKTNEEGWDKRGKLFKLHNHNKTIKLITIIIIDDRLILFYILQSLPLLHSWPIF